MGRIVAAVLAGYILIGLLVVTTDQIFTLVIPGFRSMAMPPMYYFVTSLVTDTIYTAAGGYLCCLIARQHCRKATIALIVFGEIVGLASQIALWNTVPHWFALALLLLYPPAIWLGSRLRSPA